MAEQQPPNQSAISYCADLVQKHDPDRFMTVMLAPTDRRAGLASLYAFNLEVAKTREAVSEGMIGDIRLQWWRDAIEECFSGKHPRRHAVVEALAETIRRHDLPRGPFDVLIDTRAQDLYEDPPADMEAFNTYIEGTSVTLADLALCVLGIQNEGQCMAARNAARAFAIIGQLRALPVMLRQRRNRLPLSLMREHGVDARALSEMVFHPSLGDLVEALCERAEAEILAARTVKPSGAYPVIAQARIADCYRKRLLKVGFNPFLPSIEEKPVFLPLLLMLDRLF